MHQKDLQGLSDEELMASYQHGNEEAFNCLYGRYSGKVYGYLMKRLTNRQAADEVFQASFLKLHRSKDQFSSSFAFAPWLFTVVRTVLLDWQKDHRNKIINVEFNEVSIAPGSSAQTGERPDLSKLPAPQRTAIEMRYYEDLSFDEIAKRLETTPQNIRQVISRGLKRMRSFAPKRGRNK